MDISYECISQGTNSDTYKVTLKFYRDCEGIDAPGYGINPLAPARVFFLLRFRNSNSANGWFTYKYKSLYVYRIVTEEIH